MNHPETVKTEVKNAKISEATRSDAAHALAHMNDTRGLGVELASSGVHSYIVLSVEFNSVAARRAFRMPLGATVLAEFGAYGATGPFADLFADSDQVVQRIAESPFVRRVEVVARGVVPPPVEHHPAVQLTTFVRLATPRI